MNPLKQAKKKSFTLLLLILMLAVVLLPVLAQSSEGISFGIRPTKALEGQEETYSYFSFRSSPGSVFNDEALVLNDGNNTVILKLYAADGVTARNGGTDFALFGQEASGASRGAHAWISLPYSELILAPGEEQIIPFQVSIPADAKPGLYVAGLVVEAVPEVEPLDTSSNATEGEAQFNVEVIRRVGVAVVIDIPGEQISSLEIENIALYQQDEQGTTFSVDLTNTGNTFLQSEGFFIVTDRNAERLITTITLEFDTILPGDKVTFYVPRAARFADGKYLLSIVLDYGGKKAVLEGVGMNIKNGQPEIEGQVFDNLFTPEEIEVFFEKEGRSEGSVWIMIAMASFVLAILVGLVVYKAGGKKEKEENEPIF